MHFHATLEKKNTKKIKYAKAKNTKTKTKNKKQGQILFT
jgi:hypothetical protein